ncbi:MAG TPA: hypothetical protein VIR01_13670 [Pyrinomonadaceae bacterium]
MNHTKVAIAGVSSEVGKTTLLCQLLREFPGWEAIKVTRGHYRSCGKDPHACCVSHLLSDQPLVKSGFRETYSSDKDTGRYWEAGAANVHWIVVTDDQVKEGIELALQRVKSTGVLIEGNSFLQFVDVDFTVLVGSSQEPSKARAIKNSTRWAYEKASALYQYDFERTPGDLSKVLSKRFANLNGGRTIPTFSSETFSSLVSGINRIHLFQTRFPETEGLYVNSYSQRHTAD